MSVVDRGDTKPNINIAGALIRRAGAMDGFAAGAACGCAASATLCLIISWSGASDADSWAALVWAAMAIGALGAYILVRGLSSVVRESGMAKVLIVEDDPDVRRVLALALQREGHDITVADGVTAALGHLNGAEFDLLLTDVLMPGLDGFNLARMARMHHPRLRVLFLTGFYDYALTLRDPLDEVGKLLTKPVRQSELLREVEAALAVSS